MDEKKKNEVSDAMAFAMREWNITEFSHELDNSIDWRGPIKEKMRDGDVAGMAEVASPKLQASLIEMALDKQIPPATRFSAITNLLGQAGHGVTQKVAHTVDYESMDTDQLSAVLRSKLKNLADLVPGFDMKRILPPDVVDAEFTESLVDG